MVGAEKVMRLILTFRTGQNVSVDFNSKAASTLLEDSD
jgi:hypothetical protein